MFDLSQFDPSYFGRTRFVKDHFSRASVFKIILTHMSLVQFSIVRVRVSLVGITFVDTSFGQFGVIFVYESQFGPNHCMSTECSLSLPALKFLRFLLTT